jgi:hypothetical protein
MNNAVDTENDHFLQYYVIIYCANFNVNKLGNVFIA